MVRAIILVGLGGGTGSILRYLTSLFVSKYFSLFPGATLVVNVTGCFLMGLLLGLFEQQNWSHPDLKFIFVLGFCGGYTTFSTFAMENLTLLQSNQIVIAFSYMAASVVLGLAAVWLGLWMIK